MMTKTNNRYVVEQEELPKALFSRGDALLKTMMNDEGKAMVKFYRHTSAGKGFHICPYNRSAFSLNFREYINGCSSVFIVGISMPQPEKVMQCRAVYLCYGEEGGSTVYITSQLCNDGHISLCARTMDNKRHAYALTGENEFDSVAEVYWNFTRGNGKKPIPQIIMADT